MDRKQRAYKALEKLRQYLQEHPGGWADQLALQKVSQICRELRWTDSLLEEKAGSLETWATELYSVRKHEKWRSGPVDGAERIRMFMRADLQTLGDQIGWLRQD